MANKQRVTSSLIYAEIQTISKTISEHTAVDNKNFQELRQLLEGSDAAPGMKIRVDRLEQNQITKQKNLAWLWTLVSGLVVAVVASFLK